MEIKKRHSDKLIYSILIVALIILPIIYSFSFGDFLYDITGRATSAPTNLSVTIGSLNVFDISAISAQSVTESSTTNVTFSFLVDIDSGTGNLLNNTAFAVFNVSGYSTSRTTTCGRQTGINSTRANYSCSILVWYFDPAGNWSVYANITDNSNNAAQRLEQWNLSELTAIVISPQSLTWPTILAGSKNQTSNNDPNVINNTGNDEINNGNVRVTAINLIGQTDGSKFIPSANFTVFNNTAATAECNENLATALVNNTATGISNVGLQRGNNSASAGQQNLYYCIRDVGAQLTTQTYSTTAGGSWTISVV